MSDFSGNDLVSIIIPTYKRLYQLERAVRSCLNQSYENIEIVIVDDNYDDKQLQEEIFNSISKLDSRIKIFQNRKHLGGALSRNKGVELSKGKYISFLDDDDEYLYYRIEKMMRKIKEDDSISLVYSYGNIIFPNGTTKVEKTEPSGDPLAFQMMTNIAGTSFWLVKREDFEYVGGFEKIYSHQDGVVLLKILAHEMKIDIIREILVNYYVHDDNSGITAVNPRTIEADAEYHKICKEFYHKIDYSDVRKVESYYALLLAKRLILSRDNKKLKKHVKNIMPNKLVYLRYKIAIYFYSIFRKIYRYWDELIKSFYFNKE